MASADPSARDRLARERLARARDGLARAGLDALFLVSGTNLMLLSGYPRPELTLARPFYLVVPRVGEPVFLVHEGRQHEARVQSWVREVRTYRRLSVAPVEELRTLLAELGLARGRIGAELGFEQRLGMPVLELERLREAIAPAALEDAAELLWRLRFVKSESDVDALRRAGQITADAYAATFAAARGGMREREVMLEMAAGMMRLGGGSPWVAITSGRGNYDNVLGSGTERVLERGDMVWMDAGCAVRGFWSDFGRAGVVGGPSPEQLEAQRAIHEITREAVEMVRPGIAVREIAAFCNARVDELDLPITSNISGLAARVGHGLGLDVTEPPHVSEEDPTVLEAGMAITIEPGVATDFGTFHVEENVLVTQDGHELLSVAPWELATLAEE